MATIIRLVLKTLKSLILLAEALTEPINHRLYGPSRWDKHTGGGAKVMSYRARTEDILSCFLSSLGIGCELETVQHI